jgi:Flp pilus assembly protein TadD
VEETSKKGQRQTPAQLTAGIVQLFGTNDPKAAYSASRSALRHYKNYAPLWHVSGLSAARVDKLDEAARALTRATQIDPDSAAIWTDLSNILRQAGDNIGAVRAGRKAVQLDPTLPAAHNNLGVALRQSGDFQAAIAALSNAASLGPGVAEIHNNLGNSLKSAMQYVPAVEAYKKALKLRPKYAEAMANLGGAYVEMNEWDAAEECCRRALALEPHFAEAHRNLGAALYWNGDLDRAKQSLQSAVAIDPADRVARKQLALVLIGQDNFDAATELLIEGLKRDRVPPGQEANDPQLLCVTRTKIEHDAQQLAVLRAADLVPAHYDTVLSDVEMTIDNLDRRSDERVNLAEIGVGAAARYCNRVIYTAPSPALTDGALREDLDFAGIEDDFAHNSSGYALVDEILQPEALASLSQFCAQSTIWFQSNFTGELGTSMVNGFASPLIFQIARDLQHFFPNIFGKHKFQACWAYRYYADMSGLARHTDAATVSLNLWITPDDANLDPTTGGLVFWNRRGPTDLFTKPMDEKADILDAIINESGTESTAVPYRCNRALIFGAGTIHQTDRFSFKTGYDDRRSNVTFLFGPPA